MSYIGRDIRTGAFRQLDDISSGFDGSDTTHTMQVNSTNVSVGDVNQILLSLGGVIQKPGTDFTVSGSTLTFTTAPAANTSFFAILLGSDNGGTVTPTDSSVTDDKLADTISEINNTGGNLTVDVSGNIVLDADTQGSSNGILLKDAGTHYGSIFRSSSDLNIKSQASDEDIVFMGNDGGSEITAWTMDMSAGGHLLPGNAATGIYLGVNSATASNLLDDYEEGTFNGAFSGSSGAPSGVSYSHRENHYVKIGNTVYFSGYLQVSSWSSGPSGHLLFSGLPFTASSDSNYFGMFNVHYSGNFSGTDAPQTGYIPQGQTYANFITNAGSDARSGRTQTVSASNSSGNEIVVVSGFYKI